MTNWIRLEFNGRDDWLGGLSQGRREKVLKKVEEAKSGDAYIDTLLFTEFGDKVTIIKKGPNFAWGKTSFEDDLAKIQALRNSLAHASDYANTQAHARDVCKTVRLTDSWIKRLTQRASENS